MQGSRVVSEFLAHLTLNPHGEEEHSALMSDQEEVKPGALVISTIHAAKASVRHGRCIFFSAVQHFAG